MLLQTTLDSNQKSNKSPLANKSSMQERAQDRQSRMKLLKDSNQGGVKGVIGSTAANKRKRQPSAKVSAKKEKDKDKENTLLEISVNQMQGLAHANPADDAQMNN